MQILTRRKIVFVVITFAFSLADVGTDVRQCVDYFRCDLYFFILISLNTSWLFINLFKCFYLGVYPNYVVVYDRIPNIQQRWPIAEYQKNVKISQFLAIFHRKLVQKNENFLCANTLLF